MGNPELLLTAIVQLANEGTEQVLHPVMMNHFGLRLGETERLLEAEGLTFHRQIMTFGGCNKLVSEPDEPVERFRFEVPSRGFGLVIEGRN
jgi:hypothetical protein